VPLKLIHVGLGGWGTDWELNALPPIRNEVERVAIVEAYEPARDAAKTKLTLEDAQAFGALDEALEAVEADAVLITAPMEAHVPLAIQAMRAGKHVLVEKPFAGSVDEAIEAVTVAEETGKVLQVSQNYRFYPAPRTVAKLVADGVLGEVGTVNIDFRKWANDPEAGTHRHYRYVHPLLFDNRLWINRPEDTSWWIMPRVYFQYTTALVIGSAVLLCALARYQALRQLR